MKKVKNTSERFLFLMKLVQGSKTLFKSLNIEHPILTVTSKFYTIILNHRYCLGSFRDHAFSNLATCRTHQILPLASKPCFQDYWDLQLT